MKKLIIGFSDGGNALSNIIKWVTKSHVSHVFTMIADSGEIVIFQASGLKVNYENYNTFLGHEKIVEMYSIDLTDAEAEANKKFRLTNVGLPYAWQELFGFGWVLFMRKFGRVVKNPFSQGDHAYICVDTSVSQLPIDIASKIADKDGPGSMTPEDFRRWCAKNAKLFTNI
jgi:hypothetical protein